MFNFNLALLFKQIKYQRRYGQFIGTVVPGVKAIVTKLQQGDMQRGTLF